MLSFWSVSFLFFLHSKQWPPSFARAVVPPCLKQPVPLCQTWELGDLRAQMPLTPPSLRHASTLRSASGEKVTHSTWIKLCDGGLSGLGSRAGWQVSLFTALPPVRLLRDKCGGTAARWAYISVDEEINQIISGVRKRAQRGPSCSSFFEM